MLLLPLLLMMMMVTMLMMIAELAMLLPLRLVSNWHIQGHCASLNFIGFKLCVAKASEAVLLPCSFPVLRDGGLRPRRDEGSGGDLDHLTFRFMGLSPDARSTEWCRNTRYKVSKTHGSSCSCSNSRGCYRCRHIPESSGSRRWTPPGPFLLERRSWMTAGTR